MDHSTFNKDEKIKEAQVYLRAMKGDKEFDLDKAAVKALAGELQDNSVFSYARRLYQVLYQHFPGDEKIIEKLAVCTYKDTDLSSETKYDIAAKLLISHFEKDGKISNANILGVLGSIFKKKWRYDNFTGHLYQSLRYYVEGYEKAILNSDAKVSDLGYCGVNLAFVYDLLARLEAYKVRKNEVGSTTKFSSDPLAALSSDYSAKAKACRQKVVAEYSACFEDLKKRWEADKSKQASFEKDERYWFFAVWAEALLGLAQFDEAKAKFNLALGLGELDGKAKMVNPEGIAKQVAPWMTDATRTQCYELIELLYIAQPKDFVNAKKSLSPLLGEMNVAEYQNIKLGLALSGGGFRASLFHIGVLAKLAEADLLRRVEVISCVSGGSILGAYYYLELKRLVDSQSKDSLGKNDYVKLVKKIETEFLDKVNGNVRLNILSNFFRNFKIAFFGKYTRTNRTAELYDEFLYSDLLEGGKQICMDDLLITPGGDKNFRPIRDNWSMENKVPILVLNATTLNTGHSWQFTSTWMGESPAFIDSEFDALPNLRRMYYDEAPNKHRRVPLSKAVAASAGVPGLFAPVELDDLYEGTNVLLVDGGVHDNQGISTLYEQECNLIIVSDASGQLVEAENPPSNELSVFSRTNSILQERIRYSQFRDLDARKQSGLVRDFILMHLTKGLPSEVKNWKYCDDPYVPPTTNEVGRQHANILTDYLIRKKIQTLLARIRTDLDAFHVSEAYSLMYSGYQMTAHEIKLASNALFEKSNTEESETTWEFMKVQGVHDNSEASEELERKLKPSSDLFGKVFKISKLAKYTALVLLAVALILSLYFISKQLNLAWLAPYVLPAIVVIAVERLLSWLFKVRSFACSLFLLSPIMLVLWAVSLLIRLVSTRWYLWEGRLPEVKEEEKNTSNYGAFSQFPPKSTV